MVSHFSVFKILVRGLFEAIMAPGTSLNEMGGGNEDLRDTTYLSHYILILGAQWETSSGNKIHSNEKVECTLPSEVGLGCRVSIYRALTSLLWCQFSRCEMVFD